jgi:hypothetical protein
VSDNLKGKFASAYFELVMNEVRRAILPLDEEFGKATMNFVLQSGGPTEVSKKLSRKDKFVGDKIFRPMSEIIEALWAIEEIAIYVKSFPYRKQGISPMRYLQYHIENYLNEVYIFKTRLLVYLKILEKAYIRANNGQVTDGKLKPLYSAVNQVFKTYNEVRGSHVHVARFKDEDISRLSTLQLLSQSKDISFARLMKDEFEATYRNVRKKWADKIEKESSAFHMLLDYYFEELTKMLFEGGCLIIPDNYK